MGDLDNHGRPRSEFVEKLQGLDDAGFVKEAESRIWLSAYASNNPRSDYHWQADACWDEAKRRKKPDLYRRAWERALVIVTAAGCFRPVAAGEHAQAQRQGSPNSP